MRPSSSTWAASPSRPRGLAEVGADRLGPHSVRVRQLGGKRLEPAPRRLATRVTPWPREASSRAIAAPIPDEAPVINAVLDSDGAGSATLPGYLSPNRSLPVLSGPRRRSLRSRPWKEARASISSGDPDELRERLGELADQMQGAQRVAWADNAIKLAVDMTVAAINRLDLTGGSDEQAVQVRDAIRIVFPEAVTLVREAREGLS